MKPFNLCIEVVRDCAVTIFSISILMTYRELLMGIINAEKITSGEFHCSD